MKTKLIFSLVMCLASGVLVALVGYRVIASLRDGQGPVARSGGSSEPDPEYQKLPPDSQSDWMNGFTLTERSGKEVQWKDLEGKVRVTSFFFSSCPANCLQQNLKVRELQQSYQDKDVVFLSITCDPDIDTPERLREYANKLEAHPNQWLFLTGRLIYIRRVAGELFSVALDKQTHTERLIVCDKWGNIRGSFLWNKLDEMTQLKVLVDKLLAETAPPAKVTEKQE